MGFCDEEECLQTRGISYSESLPNEDDSSSADDETEDVTTEVTREAATVKSYKESVRHHIRM